MFARAANAQCRQYGYVTVCVSIAIYIADIVKTVKQKCLHYTLHEPSALSRCY